MSGVEFFRHELLASAAWPNERWAAARNNRQLHPDRAGGEWSRILGRVPTARPPAARSSVAKRHLARQLLLYVRQSTLHQVQENQEIARRR